VILEGAYSARPELADLLQLRVLLDTPDAVRDARLRAREGDDYVDGWMARWADAEAHCFGHVMPRSAFDLVL
jgi:uridine kinase